MLDFGFYNMDCMQGMKEFPDKYFDLAIVDPPYGAGFTETGGCQGWFAKYHQNAQTVENLKKGGGKYWNRFGQRFDKYKHTTNERIAENQTEHGDMQIGGQKTNQTKKS